MDFRRSLAIAVPLASIGRATGAIPSPALSESHAIRVDAPRATSERCARAFPLRRTVTSHAVLTGALRALLAGPTAAEHARGGGG